jgi:uncharacterized protein (DUF2235 family)
MSGKNIVVLSDGTGQEGGKESDTNVYKLFRMLENRTGRQVVFYDRGLGTNWLRVTGNAFGAGISHNIRECYQFIFEQFQAEDRIFLFGFSRGAFTVRSLSGFIDLFGILPKSRPELIREAWKIYRWRLRFPNWRTRRSQAAQEFADSHNTMGADIAFLGVWDTVGALGSPFKRVAAVMDRVPWFQHKFHNTNLCPCVSRGCHALAIDDERLTFHPTVWSEPNPRVQQVWFAGMHSDVGGSYAETDLSDISLQWMVRHALDEGLLLYQNHKVTGAPKPEGVMHDSREGFGALYRRKVRSWDAGTTPKVHESVTERAKKLNDYKPWILKLDNYDVVGDPNSMKVFA